MTTLPHGRGKESFRVFNRTLKDTSKYIVSAIKSGEGYTQNDVFRFFEQLINEYRTFLKGAELDVEMWTDRAIDSQIKAYDKIVSTYNLETGGNFQEEQETPREPDTSPDTEDNDESDTHLLGYEIITQDNKQLARSKSKPRKRLFTNLEELQEYVDKVPYITYIQVINNSTTGRKNYRVWVDKTKDQYKRKL